MISKDTYKMLKNVLKQSKKGNPISFADKDNIRHFRNVEGLFENYNFRNIQYPLLDFILDSSISQYLFIFYEGECFLLNEKGKEAIESYKKSINKKILSWLAIIISMISLVISLI